MRVFGKIELNFIKLDLMGKNYLNLERGFKNIKKQGVEIKGLKIKF
jgi:hypothetical protein